jgi:peptidoglycan biosynthesis protein MviN/MurJ (putative lipid II flippase)
LLYVAQQIYAAGATVISRAVGTPAFPILANHARDEEWALFDRAFRRRATALFALSIVTLALFALVGNPTLGALAHGSRFAPEQVSQLWWLLLALGGMWIGGAVGTVSSVAYYAKGDTRTPTWLSMVSFTIYVPIKVGAFFAFGILGLAACISAYYLANAALQVALLVKRLPSRGVEPKSKTSNSHQP